MSAQLRADVVRALGDACEQVKEYESGAPHLVDGVIRLIDGVLRFIKLAPDIAEVRRSLIEQLEITMLLIDLEFDLDISIAGNSRSNSAIRAARAHAIEAVQRLQATVLEQGRVSDAGDRVGLGKMGAPIR